MWQNFSSLLENEENSKIAKVAIMSMLIRTPAKRLHSHDSNAYAAIAAKCFLPVMACVLKTELTDQFLFVPTIEVADQRSMIDTTPVESNPPGIVKPAGRGVYSGS